MDQREEEHLGLWTGLEGAKYLEDCGVNVAVSEDGNVIYTCCGDKIYVSTITIPLL